MLGGATGAAASLATADALLEAARDARDSPHSVARA